MTCSSANAPEGIKSKIRKVTLWRTHRIATLISGARAIMMLFIFGLLLLSSLTNAAQAQREFDIPLVRMTPLASAVTGVIEVISTNGERWTEVKDNGELTLPVRIEIRTAEGYYLSKIDTGLGISSKTIGASEIYQTEYDQTITFKSSTADYTEFYQVTYDIVDLCNEKLSNGQGLDQSYQIAYDLSVFIYAFFSPPDDGGGATQFRIVKLPVLVNCLKYVRGLPGVGSDDLAFDPGSMALDELKLFLTTFSNATSQPNAATVCKKGKLTVRAKTNQAGSVYVRVLKKIGDGAMTQEIKQIWSEHQSDGTFVGYHEEWIEVDRTSRIMAFAEEVDNPLDDNPFFKQTEREYLQLTCTGAGGEGLATPDANNPDAPRPSWSGELIMADSATGRDNSCPRQGQVFYRVNRTEPGSFNYRISCSNGKLFQGNTNSFNQGGQDWEAAGAHNLDITKTRKISCNLQEIRPSGAPVSIASTSFDYICIKRTTEPGSNDLSSGRDPTSSSPLRPVRANPPKPKKPAVRKNPPKLKKPAVRANPPKPKKPAVRKNPPKPKKPTVRTNPPKPKKPAVRANPPKPKKSAVRTNSISCKGGKVRNGKCRCGSKKKRRKLGKNSFMCFKPAG